MTPMTQQAQSRLHDVHNSFTGKAMTASQIDVSLNLSEIIHRGIRKTASFHRELKYYARAFSDTEKFNEMKAQTILRDIFKARYGKTMNQMREDVLKREANLPEQAKKLALTEARQIELMIRDGATLPFYQAYDHAGRVLADQLNISETGAKELMKTTYSEVEGRDLYETGKSWEKRFHEPVREAERAARQASRTQTRTRSRG